MTCCWKWNDMDVIWESGAAENCGLFPINFYKTAVENDNTVNEPLLKIGSEHIWQLRRLGQYENQQNRIPPSVGVIIVLGLAVFCIWKTGRR